jgi:multidrug efflux pump subunit AcrA (membrane-fusion protein)
MSAKWRPTRAWVARICVLLLLAGAGFGVYRLRKAQAGASFPNTPVRKGEFLVLIRCRGGLAASRSVGVYTPVVPNLRIAWVAPAGEGVKAGDPILRFDSSTAQQQLMQKQMQLKQAEATLDQALAQAKTTVQQDQTDLADVTFSVERARVQVEQAAIRSRLQGDASRIDLKVAEQKLKVQDATVGLHQASDKSRIASLTRQRDQVRTDVEITKSRIAEMELKAPISGVLTLKTNCSGAITSADCKPYKVGDSVSSNMVLGQIPDLTTLEMDAKLEEADRGRITVNQDVLVRVDAIPELAIPAKVRAVSSLAEISTDYPYTRSFRAYASILRPDARLRPEMNGGMDIIVSRIPDAISIPSKALFTRAGKPIVYLAEKGRYRAVEVEVQARNPDEVAISGISAGSTVALVDIEKQGPKK